MMTLGQIMEAPPPRLTHILNQSDHKCWAIITWPQQMDIYNKSGWDITSVAHLIVTSDPNIYIDPVITYDKQTFGL